MGAMTSRGVQAGTILVTGGSGFIGSNYVRLILKKYPDAKTPPNLHYNPYFANLNIAMPPPLTTNGQVTYADGTPSTVNQMATDVAAFLVWTAEPNLESRHAAGLAVVIFLLFATILAYLAKRQIWHGGAETEVRPTGVLDPANKEETLGILIEREKLSRPRAEEAYARVVPKAAINPEAIRKNMERLRALREAKEAEALRTKGPSTATTKTRKKRISK